MFCMLYVCIHCICICDVLHAAAECAQSLGKFNKCMYVCMYVYNAACMYVYIAYVNVRLYMLLLNVLNRCMSLRNACMYVYTAHVDMI